MIYKCKMGVHSLPYPCIKIADEVRGITVSAFDKNGYVIIFLLSEIDYNLDEGIIKAVIRLKEKKRCQSNTFTPANWDEIPILDYTK